VYSSSRADYGPVIGFSVRVSLLNIFMSNILPLFPAVPIVPKIGHTDVKANTESEGSNKDGSHVDTVSLDKGVVKGGRERHGWERMSLIDRGKAERSGVWVS